MRRANQNVAVFKDGENILLSFGFDFCSEHEWGTKGISAAFGISHDEADLTVQRLAVTKANDLQLIEAEVTSSDYSSGQIRKVKHTRLYLLGGRLHLFKETPQEFVVRYRESSPRSDAPEALWDERSFMFSVPCGGEHEQVVREIHHAIQAGDALMYNARSGNPFGGSGFVIARRSTVPRPLIENMEAGFRDAKALKEAAEATGIRARVEAWAEGKRSGSWSSPAFFALSPSWLKQGFTTKDGPRKSEHPVMFWLNPYDQQNNNAGWYTVEELDQWIAGKGPIPKTAEQRRKRA